MHKLSLFKIPLWPKLLFLVWTVFLYCDISKSGLRSWPVALDFTTLVVTAILIAMELRNNEYSKPDSKR